MGPMIQTEEDSRAQAHHPLCLCRGVRLLAFRVLLQRDSDMYASTGLTTLLFCGAASCPAHVLRYYTKNMYTGMSS